MYAEHYRRHNQSPPITENTLQRRYYRRNETVSAIDRCSVCGHWGKQREILSSSEEGIEATFRRSAMPAHMCLLIWIIYWCFVFLLPVFCVSTIFYTPPLPRPEVNDGQFTSFDDNYPVPSPLTQFSSTTRSDNVETKLWFTCRYFFNQFSEQMLSPCLNGTIFFKKNIFQHNRIDVNDVH